MSEIIITKGGRDHMILLMPMLPKDQPNDPSARAVAATGDDLIVGLGVVREANDGGKPRTLEEERDAAVATAVAFEAQLALALDLLGPEMREAMARPMPRSPRDVALRKLAGDEGALYLLGEWRTYRALAKEAMHVIASARVGIWPKKEAIDGLLGRLATALGVLVVEEA